MPPRLTFTRTADDSATDVGYLHEDGQYAAVRIADISDPETIAGQLRVLADMLTRGAMKFGQSFNPSRRK